MKGKNKFQNILVVASISLVLLFPYIERQTDMITEEKLHGHFERVAKPSFSWAGWMDNAFQSSYGKWLEQTIGLRPFFVNVYNQYRYSLFEQISASGAFLGKDRVLFQTSYLNSFMGYDYLGASAIKKSVRKMKLVQDELARRGKLFFFVIAPGKAFYYPEYLPDSVRLSRRDTTNYQVFANQLGSQGVNHIDFLDYFLKAKDTTQYPLYPRTGTHWSGYGVVKVCDSLLSYVEANTEYDLVDYTIVKGVSTKTDLRHTDDDIEKGLNLALDIPDWEMYYPELSFGDTAGKSKPIILDIGDSYNQSFWGFYPFFQQVFSNDSRFWYYYRTSQWPGITNVSGPHLKDLDLSEKLNEYDIVMIVATEANLHYNGYGFVEDAFRCITDPGKAQEKQRQKEIEGYISTIKKDPKWLKSVKEKAKAKGIGLEEMIRKDAIWMVDREK